MRIELHNVGPYYGINIIEPVIRKRDQGPITLIAGLNGSGKTTLLNAVLLALYGNRSPAFIQHAESYSSYLSRIRSRGNDDNVESSITLDMEIGASRLRLKRSWKTAKKRVVDRLEIWRDDISDVLLAKAWDSHVEDIMPSELATLFLFDGERIGELAESEETPEPIRRAMQTILGISTVDRVIHDLEKIIRYQTKKLDGVSEEQKLFRQIETTRRDAENRRTLLNQQLAKVTANLDRAEYALRTARSEYFKLGGALVGERSVEEAYQKVGERLSHIRGNMLELASGALPLVLVKKMLESIKVQAERELNTVQAQTALPIMELANQDLEQVLLKNSIDSHSSALLQAVMHQHIERLKAVVDEPPVFSLSHHAFAQLTYLTDTQLVELQKITSDTVARYGQAEQEQDYIALHANNPSNEDVLNKMLERIEHEGAQVSELQRQKKIIEEEIRSLERELGQLTNQLTQAAKTLSQHNEGERIIRFAMRSREAQTKFRATLLSHRVSQLEEAIREALVKLLRKKHLIDGVKIDPETLRINLYDRRGQELPRLGFSSGERQMLALSILWGLSMVAPEKLPIIIDTPMGRLDTQHREHFVREYLPMAGEQVVVLSTDSEITTTYEDLLGKHIGRRYELNYDEGTERSTIVEVSLVKEIQSHDYQAGTP